MRILKFLSTLTVALLLTLWVFRIGWIWGGLYFEAGPSLVLASFGAVALPWLFNQALTRSYRKIEWGASLWNSLLGMTIAFHLFVLVLCGSGLVFSGGGIAARESLGEMARVMGQSPEVASRYIESLPMSEVRGTTLWVPNLGNMETPRVVLRNAEGQLKAEFFEGDLPYFEVDNRFYMVGKVEPGSNLMVLMPVPVGSRDARAQAEFAKGMIYFNWETKVVYVTPPRRFQSLPG